MNRFFSFAAAILFSFSCLAQTELPAIDLANKADFFIPSSTTDKYTLKQAQADDFMKVYNNLATDAAIQRVNDIRWMAADKKEADDWYSANKKLLSEGGDDITTSVKKPAGTDQWNVYTASKQMREMLESFGVKQNHFYFTFTVDRFVAKIFIATSDKQQVADAWLLAKEGLRTTLMAAGKKELARQL